MTRSLKILLLDPSLSVRLGHNAAILEELARELGGNPDVAFSCACAASTRRSDFADLDVDLRPVFRIEGYTRLAPHDVTDLERQKAIRTAIIQDLWPLALDRWDVILMPTMYPLHLMALADCASELGQARLVCGMLMPLSFWTPDATAKAMLARGVAGAIAALQARTGGVFYSETGLYDLGGGPVPTPLMLPPVSTATLALLADLAQADPAGHFQPPAGPLKAGFFGNPFVDKGLAHLVRLIEQGVPAGVQIVLRLPPGHERLCQQLNAASAQVDASSRPMANEAYLREMAGVDVVLAHYDPAHYGEKMSGIVPEAICLGKPLLLGEGCHAIADFLDRHAPGSFVCAPFSHAGLAAALALPAQAWHERRQCAAASSDVMRALKSMRRYLGIAGAGAVYAPASRMALAA